MRLVVAEQRAGVGSRGNGTDLDLWMAEQQTEQLAARVTGGPGDRNPNCHMHDYAIEQHDHANRGSRIAVTPGYRPRVSGTNVYAGF